MKNLIVILGIATVWGCAYSKPRYESTSAWIDPQNELVLIEVARPTTFVGCDTMSGDRECRERRGYSDFRTLVVDIREGRVSGEARTSGPTAPILDGYPDLAPREFAAHVNVFEVIAGQTVNYRPYAPTVGGWLYYAPGRKRVALLTNRQQFAATNVDELAGIGADAVSIRVLDWHHGQLRVAKQERDLQGAFLLDPVNHKFPEHSREQLSISQSGQYVAYTLPQLGTLVVVDVDTATSQSIALNYSAEAAFISNDTLLVVEHKAENPRTELITVNGTQVPVTPIALDLRQRVLLPDTSTVGFVQTNGIVFVAPNGAFAEFPPPVGPVSVTDERIRLMYTDDEAGDHVLVDFNMNTGEEAELARFESYATLLGASGDTLVVYAPNPLQPGTMLYFIDEEITEMRMSTRLKGEPIMIFGPIVMPSGQ